MQPGLDAVGLQTHRVRALINSSKKADDGNNKGHIINSDARNKAPSHHLLQKHAVLTIATLR